MRKRNSLLRKSFIIALLVHVGIIVALIGIIVGTARCEVTGEGRRMSVEIVLVQETLRNNDPARIEVYENGVLVEIIVAELRAITGADGGRYPSVFLRKGEVTSVDNYN